MRFLAKALSKQIFVTRIIYAIMRLDLQAMCIAQCSYFGISSFSWNFQVRSAREENLYIRRQRKDAKVNNR